MVREDPSGHGQLHELFLVLLFRDFAVEPVVQSLPRDTKYFGQAGEGSPKARLNHFHRFRKGGLCRCGFRLKCHHHKKRWIAWSVTITIGALDSPCSCRPETQDLHLVSGWWVIGSGQCRAMGKKRNGIKGSRYW